MSLPYFHNKGVSRNHKPKEYRRQCNYQKTKEKELQNTEQEVKKWATFTPLKPGVDLKCSERVSRFCSTSDTPRKLRSHFSAASATSSHKHTVPDLHSLLLQSQSEYNFSKITHIYVSWMCLLWDLIIAHVCEWPNVSIQNRASVA